ncbi:MAG: Nif3-like dinuclear metal center hexameric protein [Planctomycetes bacterium]|nr:Nif3-like dinuclear metal center hexameric protein [Planctomycetota bacterium]
MTTASLAEVLDILNEIAPLELAAEWDNVGLLLQPHRQPPAVRRALLTIDLTEAVVAEAKKLGAQLVVSYHPPIFQPLKRLRHGDGKQGALLAAAAAGLIVFSPHTALDAAPGGLADWLVECALGGDRPAEVRPCGEGEFGRVLVLKKSVRFATLLQRLKRAFLVKHLRLALPGKAPKNVRSIAIAAGSGAGALRGCAADVVVTGEMSHHDALAVTSAGGAVVLAGHSNTERGFLPELRRRLTAAFDGDLDVRIATSDVDPFVIG